MEHESHHAHHPHGTGLRWLDVTLAVAATIVSLVSLWLGLHSAHSMEKLVAANSYPYLEQYRAMSSPATFPDSDRKRGRIEYLYQNNGTGPARIDWVELTFDGKPMADITALLDACCAAKRDDIRGMSHRGAVVGTLVRPGDMVSMFSWDEPVTPNPVFGKLHGLMNKISITTCYCSVFDDCYVRRPDATKPEPVKECKAPARPFRPGFRDD
ncbi:hypothetical protein IP91_00887 [Pseudoduganella lurida]|uniref:Uncharacterized protein n=1 Tax=Pseudoduganella lurida TaxID=1036180 RepID=A0A562RMH5_9BURK|nr:hypothetical protein [Pseudoduganella lurida]TWI69814.1 hypothetical protein IP91_00887 [Pseudoduganella lurida]